MKLYLWSKIITLFMLIRKTIELTGYTLEELIQKPISELIYEDDVNRIKKMYDECIESINKTDINKLRCNHKTEGIHWCQIKATRILWENSPAMLHWSRY